MGGRRHTRSRSHAEVWPGALQRAPSLGRVHQFLPPRAFPTDPNQVLPAEGQLQQICFATRDSVPALPGRLRKTPDQDPAQTDWLSPPGVLKLEAAGWDWGRSIQVGRWEELRGREGRRAVSWSAGGRSRLPPGGVPFPSLEVLKQRLGGHLSGAVATFAAEANGNDVPFPQENLW